MLLAWPPSPESRLRTRLATPGGEPEWPLEGAIHGTRESARPLSTLLDGSPFLRYHCSLTAPVELLGFP